ncbi:MAG: hypothetical protein KGN77_11135 [Xanthomonadaceae bacterium]|nr:hypothetical protein [Xanthomonadaceae bacterium]
MESILIYQTRANQRAKEYVFGSTRWLNAVEVKALTGSRTSDPRSLLSRWKREGKIFALKVDGEERVPIYLLDPDRGFKPRPAVREILAAFAGRWSDWALANWFASGNGYLDGNAPMDCLDGPSEMLVRAAEAAAGNHLHG